MKVLKIKFAIWDFDKLFVDGIVLRLNSKFFWIFIQIWYFKNKFRNFKILGMESHEINFKNWNFGNLEF